MNKPKTEDIIWDGKCIFCNDTRLTKLFSDEDMGFICLGCGAGYKEVNGVKVYAPELNIQLNNKFKDNIDEES